MRVEVIYALANSHDLAVVELAPGGTVGEAIRASGIADRHPEIDLKRSGAGIFGRLVPLEQPLADGDRVEIYRPLLADPKDLRRRRAGRPGP